MQDFGPSGRDNDAEIVAELLMLVERALTICDQAGHAFVAIDLASALDKLEVIRDGGAKRKP